MGGGEEYYEPIQQGIQESLTTGIEVVHHNPTWWTGIVAACIVLVGSIITVVFTVKKKKQ